MNLTIKILVLLCVTLFCSAEDDQNYSRTSEACFVQYLKQKGKLEDSFLSLQTPTSQCLITVPIVVQAMKSEAISRFSRECSQPTDCLTKEFENHEAVDYLLKLATVSSSAVANETAKITILNATRNEFKNKLEIMATVCKANVTEFVGVFHIALGIKNETLEARQFYYCATKYVVDRKILQLNNVRENPHQIHTENVNCEQIIDTERRNNERLLKDSLDKYAMTDCTLRSYTTNNGFDFEIAMSLLHHLDIPDREKEPEINRLARSLAKSIEVSDNCK